MDGSSKRIEYFSMGYYSYFLSKNKYLHNSYEINKKYFLLDLFKKQQLCVVKKLESYSLILSQQEMVEILQRHEEELIISVLNEYKNKYKNKIKIHNDLFFKLKNFLFNNIVCNCDFCFIKNIIRE